MMFTISVHKNNFLKTSCPPLNQFPGKNDFFWHFLAGKDVQQRLHELMRHRFQTVIHGSQFRSAAGRKNGIIVTDYRKIFRDAESFALRVFYAADCQRIVGGKQSVKSDAAVGNVFDKVRDIPG